MVTVHRRRCRRAVNTARDALSSGRSDDEHPSGASDHGRRDVGGATPARGRLGRSAALLLRRERTIQNRPYDGRFAFARVRYRASLGGNWAGPSWAHGYPVAEQNLMRIMLDLSLLDADVDDVNVVTLDDPELFRYPIAYIIESLVDAHTGRSGRIEGVPPQGGIPHRGTTSSREAGGACTAADGNPSPRR